MGETLVDVANEIFTLLSGALTPVIAIVALYIAWCQHQTAQGKLKLDLYDRRFKVYRGLMDLLAAVVRDAKVSRDELAKYYVETNERQFLFDEDIVHFMTQVRDKAIDLHRVNNQMEKLSDGREDELHQLTEQDSELLRWFIEQEELAPGRFEKYLGFKRNL